MSAIDGPPTQALKQLRPPGGYPGGRVVRDTCCGGEIRTKNEPLISNIRSIVNPRSRPLLSPPHITARGSAPESCQQAATEVAALPARTAGAGSCSRRCRWGNYRDVGAAMPGAGSSSARLRGQEIGKNFSVLP